MVRPGLRWCLAAAALGGWVASGDGATGQQAPPQTPPGQAAPQNPAQTPTQGQTPQQPPKPVFRTGADLVRVDVAVLDKKGEPVRR